MAIPYTPIIRRDKRCNKTVITYDPIIRRKECRTKPEGVMGIGFDIIQSTLIVY